MDPNFATSGLSHVWTQGDWVTRSVAIVLLIMSLSTWVIILWKALDLRAQRAQAKGVEAFWHSADFADGLNKLGTSVEGNPFRAVALEGREATRHILHKDGHNGTPPQRQLHDSLDVSDWVERSLRKSVDDYTARAQSGLSVLASVASTAPFVGLFGTVWGIYHALLSIGAAGQVSIDRVAGPIGEALIMTALGLLVAIPAVLGFNALVRGNKSVSHQLNRFAHDLHAYFVTGARVTGGGTADGKVLPMKKAS
ncbi:MotA/TolQ/ExbB proton channel family protein [Hydrogenophaga palleronii]|uniref:MotA/TolQ/ExbB proton channel family protein n=1 Tax=Hydrogenophaga palleronii TaxID=65655 RepID=UPI0008242F07|nr:MotA/TolQ/ExbB proton channel family protein [Hydrogenophaga palleronii]